MSTDPLPPVNVLTAHPRRFFNKKAPVITIIFLLIVAVILGILFKTGKIQIPISKPPSIISLGPIQSAKDAGQRAQIISAHFSYASGSADIQKMLVDAANYVSPYPDRPAAAQEAARGGLYGSVFGQLKGEYYATRDPEVLALAQQLREFIKNKYPAEYKGGDNWDIVGE